MTPNPTITDRRPDPKPRQHIRLWQAYLWWYEIMEMRKRHTLRISSIERGKSMMDAQFEREMMQLVGPLKKDRKTGEWEQSGMDGLINHACKLMISEGEKAGPVWTWLTSIKGLKAGSMAAQLIAQIDDISKSHTVSALWRFSGFAVVNGQAEHNQKGVKSPFNRKLKGVCYNIADQFIRQQTPVYIDIYYAEKERQYKLHPEPLCRECKIPAVSKMGKDKDGKSVKKWRCPDDGNHAVSYTPAHLHNRAWRKMIKIFLQHLYIVWKHSEGLPISKPYIHDVGGHTHYVPPPNFDVKI